MKVVVFGMNHRSAPVEIRERFAVADVGPALRKLVDRPEIGEAVLLSTCNRVELVATTPNPDAAQHVLLDFFARELAGGDLPSKSSLRDMTYLRVGREAVEHVFRVASAVDSMVVGEPQILGQVKDAYRAAAEAGTCGAVLSRLFQRAFATAKRVKNETGIAERPVSVARVAVLLAKQIFETLEDKRALLIGAGDMIEAALIALHDHGLGSRRVVNRTRAHAEALARRFDGTAHGLDELDALLPECDVVLACVGGTGPILTRERIEASLRRRHDRPLFLIDIGVPRNIDPAVHEIDSAYLYDLDDLQEVADSNEEERRREVARAEHIIVEEREHFEGWLVALQAVPTIRDLTRRAESIRKGEVERFAGRLGLDEPRRELLEQLTRAIVAKLLHAPVSRLRDETDREAGLIRLEEARVLFALDEPAGSGGRGDSDEPEPNP
ncbi:MAG: glutamyl-tRNA reductase [Deltaproteobacteria bacterium]|nr:glutamyl-tRNA reductase [Deltaproteobacteria bacterium]